MSTVISINTKGTRPFLYVPLWLEIFDIEQVLNINFKTRFISGNKSTVATYNNYYVSFTVQGKPQVIFSYNNYIYYIKDYEENKTCYDLIIIGEKSQVSFISKYIDIVATSDDVESRVISSFLSGLRGTDVIIKRSNVKYTIDLQHGVLTIREYQLLSDAITKVEPDLYAKLFVDIVNNNLAFCKATSKMQYLPSLNHEFLSAFYLKINKNKANSHSLIEDNGIVVHLLCDGYHYKLYSFDFDKHYLIVEKHEEEKQSETRASNREGLSESVQGNAPEGNTAAIQNREETGGLFYDEQSESFSRVPDGFPIP